jgi:hypothetical protein
MPAGEGLPELNGVGVAVAVASPADVVEGTAAGVGSAPPAPGWTPGNPKKSGTPAEPERPVLGTRAGPEGKPGMPVSEGLPKLNGVGVAVASPADVVEGSAAARWVPGMRGFVAGGAASAGPGAGFNAGLGPAMLGKPHGPGAAALEGAPPWAGKLKKPGKPRDPGALEGPPPCDGKLGRPGKLGKPNPGKLYEPGKPGKPGFWSLVGSGG